MPGYMSSSKSKSEFAFHICNKYTKRNIMGIAIRFLSMVIGNAYECNQINSFQIKQNFFLLALLVYIVLHYFYWLPFQHLPFTFSFSQQKMSINFSQIYRSVISCKKLEFTQLFSFRIFLDLEIQMLKIMTSLVILFLEMCYSVYLKFKNQQIFFQDKML